MWQTAGCFMPCLNKGRGGKYWPISNFGRRRREQELYNYEDIFVFDMDLLWLYSCI